jgi:transcriptional regulator with XRE-family HTH domain
MNIPNESLSGTQFYVRLKQAFERAGLPTTQMQIAELLRVSQASVSKWKQNKAYPSRKVIGRAAELTRVSLPWLYFGVGAMSDKPDHALYAIMRYYEVLPLSGRKRLLRSAREHYEDAVADRMIDPMQNPPDDSITPEPGKNPRKHNPNGPDGPGRRGR